MGSTPGPAAPGAAEPTRETLYELGVAIDATGVTDIAKVMCDEMVVKRVRIDSTQQDFDFNIEHNGNDLFSSEQSPSSGEEEFNPGQNKRTGGNGDAELGIDVSAASATANATADVMLDVEYRENR